MAFKLKKFVSEILPTLPMGVQDLSLAKAEYKPDTQSIKVYFNDKQFDGVASDNFTYKEESTEWVLGEWNKRLELNMDDNKSFGTEDKMFQYVTDLINAKKGAIVRVKVSPSNISPTLLNAQILKLVSEKPNTDKPTPSPATVSDDEDVPF